MKNIIDINRQISKKKKKDKDGLKEFEEKLEKEKKEGKITGYFMCKR